MIIKGTNKEHPVWEIILGFLLVSFTVFTLIMFLLEGDFFKSLFFTPMFILILIFINEFMISQKGIWLDIENHRFRKYKKIILIDLPFGKWHPLPILEKCVLRCRNDFVKTSHRFSWQLSGYREVNYRIYLVNRTCNYSQIFYHTTNQNLAKSKLNELVQTLNVESEIVFD